MKHVNTYSARGRTYHYFRAGGAKIRLHGDPGSPEFQRQYRELLAAHEASLKAEGQQPGTVAALIDDYRRSPEFQSNIRPATQAAYLVNLRRLDVIARARVADIRRKHILALRDELADRPRAADHFVSVVSRLLSWAVNRGYIDVHPLQRVERISKATSYATWTDAECERFEQSEPPSMLMTAYMLGLYTGQRRGDVLKMTRRSYDGEAIEVVQSKTGTTLWIPAHSRLREHLDALPRDRLLWVVSAAGGPMRGDVLSHMMARHLADLGLAHLSYHGLRHTAATRLADAGCNDREIASIIGHRTASMIARYTQRADQRARARAAVLKLERRG